MSGNRVQNDPADVLRRLWDDQMERGRDRLPPWYWNRAQREARREAWVAARLRPEQTSSAPATAGARPSNPGRSPQ